MRRLESIMEAAFENDLAQAFKDLAEWRATGVLRKDSPVRRWHQEFETSNGIEYPIHAMENAVLFEIAKRYYEAKEIAAEMAKELL